MVVTLKPSEKTRPRGIGCIVQIFKTKRTNISRILKVHIGLYQRISYDSDRYLEAMITNSLPLSHKRFVTAIVTVITFLHYTLNTIL